MRTIIFILCSLMVEVSLIGQTLTGIVVSTNQPSTIQTDPSVDLWNLGAVAHPNGYLNAGGYLLNGQSLIGTANSFSYVIASNVVQSTVVSVVSNQIALNFGTNINISGVGLSNGNASAQSLSVADSFLAAQTTNVVVVTNAGTDIAKGTYLISGTFAGFANYTNQGGIKITNSGSLWIIYQTGVGSLYSSATLINQAWTQVSGNTPVPVSRYGMDIYMNGDLWGAILSTNLSDRLARSSNDATSFSFSQMTNVVSITSNGILVAVTNVFNSSTNATFKNSFTTNNEANARAVVTNIYYSQTTNTFTSSLTTTNTASGITNFGVYYGNGSGLTNTSATNIAGNATNQIEGQIAGGSHTNFTFVSTSSGFREYIHFYTEATNGLNDFELTFISGASGHNVVRFQNTNASGYPAIVGVGPEGAEWWALGHDNANGFNFEDDTYYDGLTNLFRPPPARLHRQLGYWASRGVTTNSGNWLIDTNHNQYFLNEVQGEFVASQNVFNPRPPSGGNDYAMCIVGTTNTWATNAQVIFPNGLWGSLYVPNAVVTTSSGTKLYGYTNQFAPGGGTYYCLTLGGDISGPTNAGFVGQTALTGANNIGGSVLYGPGLSRGNGQPQHAYMGIPIAQGSGNVPQARTNVFEWGEAGGTFNSTNFANFYYGVTAPSASAFLLPRMQAGQTNATAATTLVISFAAMPSTNYTFSITGNGAALSGSFVTAKTTTSVTANMTIYTGLLDWVIVEQNIHP